MPGQVTGLGRVLRVPCLGGDSKQSFAPICALNAAAQSVGLHTSYSQLMFLGGGAFRIAWGGDWPALNAVACGEDVLANAADTQGFAAETLIGRKTEQVWARIAESIESGIPILTCGILEEGEWAVIIGYDEIPQRLCLRTCLDSSPEPTQAEFRSWRGWTYKGEGANPVVILRRTGRVMEENKAIPAALERAVRFAEESEFTFNGETYFSGPRAYSEMAGSIRDIRDGVDAAGTGERVRVLNLTIGAVIDARHAAIDHLEVIKRRGARQQIYDATVAVDKYAKEIRELEAAMAELPWHHDKPRGEALREAASMAGDDRRRDRCAASIWKAGEEEGMAVAALSRILRSYPQF